MPAAGWMSCGCWLRVPHTLESGLQAQALSTATGGRRSPSCEGVYARLAARAPLLSQNRLAIASRAAEDRRAGTASWRWATAEAARAGVEPDVFSPGSKQ
mmetsp:Transcript_104421/g.223229  ORF Transcript_104421/g.223229 Transcript_104421/m.223229 type:complete len:100 (+) Transcript_104421:35-334(+)